MEMKHDVHYLPTAGEAPAAMNSFTTANTEVKLLASKQIASDSSVYGFMHLSATKRSKLAKQLIFAVSSGTCLGYGFFPMNNYGNLQVMDVFSKESYGKSPCSPLSTTITSSRSSSGLTGA